MLYLITPKEIKINVEKPIKNNAFLGFRKYSTILPIQEKTITKTFGISIKDANRIPHKKEIVIIQKGRL